MIHRYSDTFTQKSILFRQTVLSAVVRSICTHRLWVNSDVMFYETFIEKNKEISAYLRDKQIDCCTLSINQHHPAIENDDSDRDVLLH